MASQLVSFYLDRLQAVPGREIKSDFWPLDLLYTSTNLSYQLIIHVFWLITLTLNYVNYEGIYFKLQTKTSFNIYIFKTPHPQKFLTSVFCIGPSF